MGRTFIRTTLIACGAMILAVASVSPGFTNDNENLLRFRAEVITALQKERPQRTFTPDPADPARILSGPHTMDVTNIFNKVRAYPEDPKDEIIADFVTAIIGTMGPLDEFRLEELVTVLRSTGYVDHLRGTGITLVTKPIASDVHAVVMRNTPRTFMTIEPENFPNKSRDELYEIGMQNTTELLPDLASDHQDNFSLYYLDGEYDLTNSLALMPEFWAIVRARFGDDFIFAIPRRDQLFVFDAKRSNSKASAISLIQATFAQNHNLLSPQVFELDNGKITSIWAP